MPPNETLLTVHISVHIQADIKKSSSCNEVLGPKLAGKFIFFASLSHSIHMAAQRPGRDITMVGFVSVQSAALLPNVFTLTLNKKPDSFTRIYFPPGLDFVVITAEVRAASSTFMDIVAQFATLEE